MFNDPDRNEASTTTVPHVRAAMRRLRLRKRLPIGATPGGCSVTTAPGPGDGSEQLGVTGWIEVVDPSREDRDRHSIHREDAAVRRSIDPKCSAGHHCEAPLAHPDREVRGQL